MSSALEHGSSLLERVPPNLVLCTCIDAWTALVLIEALDGKPAAWKEVVAQLFQARGRDQ
jgi:hypothetical protein